MHYSLLCAVTFLAAFLLFQIELIVSKVLLPHYGGSFVVWGACLVFFQFTLLLGYVFAHRVVRRIGVARYRWAHLGLLLLPLVSFPGRNLSLGSASSGIPLVADIFMVLAWSIGLVFFALSTISVFSQAYVAASRLPQRSNPYLLYAVSNLASFLALFTYPLLWEVYFDLGQQLLIWRLGYVAFVLCYWAVAAKVPLEPMSAPAVPAAAGEGEVPWWKRQFDLSMIPHKKVYWLVLSAAGSILFLSVNNIITYEIVPGPFLWIIPLCLFLFSFTAAFREKPIACPLWVFEKPYLVFACSVAVFVLYTTSFLPLIVEVGLFFYLLWISSMLCNRWLYESRPEDVRQMTSFYLCLAVGGFLGSFFVTWIVPVFFREVVEYAFGFWFLAAAYIYRQASRERFSWKQARFAAYMGVFLFLWLKVYNVNYNVFGAALLIWVLFRAFRLCRDNARLLLLALVVSFSTVYLVQITNSQIVFVARNYYGIYKVLSPKGFVTLNHGSIIHGAQSLQPEYRKEPLLYFSRPTPVGMVLDSSLGASLRRIAVVGLGTGTLAAYGRPGQQMDFYELDPKVHEIAKTFFSYLDDSSATIRHIFGDARLSLDKAPDASYDVLLLDAFSGDSIPVHLITVEALAQYRRILSPGGFIMVHISNRYLDLAPVLFSNAGAVGAKASFHRNTITEKSPPMSRSISDWVVITWDEGRFAELGRLLDPDGNAYKRPVKAVRPWTDTYSNLLAVFKARDMVYPLKKFAPFSW